MQKEQAQKIADFLKQYAALQNEIYSIPNIIDDELINNFHNWANGNVQTGTFLVSGAITSLWQKEIAKMIYKDWLGKVPIVVETLEKSNM